MKPSKTWGKKTEDKKKESEKKIKTREKKTKAYSRSALRVLNGSLTDSTGLKGRGASEPMIW